MYPSKSSLVSTYSAKYFNVVLSKTSLTASLMRIHSCFCAGGSDSILSTNVIGPSNSLIISPAEISSAGTLNWYPPLAPRTLQLTPHFLKDLQAVLNINHSNYFLQQLTLMIYILAPLFSKRNHQCKSISPFSRNFHCITSLNSNIDIPILAFFELR